jgi:copper chaperone CopZ
MQKIILKILDFHCPACVLRLEGIEDDVAGISSVKASYTKQTMEVTYDENILEPESILAAVKDIGYTPVLAN